MVLMIRRIGQLNSLWRSRLRYTLALLLSGALGFLVATFVVNRQHAPGKYVKVERVADSAPSICAVERGSHANSLLVPAEVVQRLNVSCTVVESAPQPSPLRLKGSLFLDSNRLSHVRSRFMGEVIEIGHRANTNEPLRVGDAVRKGQLLAVLWSNELGEKKSELVEAYSRLRLNQQTVDRLHEAREAVAERVIREAERVAEGNRIEIARIERTLETWRVSASEIADLREECKGFSAASTASLDHSSLWARVELLAAIDGVIMEKNVAIGDMISNELDAFKLADLSRLDVMAYAYDNEVETLRQQLQHSADWFIQCSQHSSLGSLRGKIERIAPLVDPVQRTAVVIGSVDNPGHTLNVGEFVTTTIDLPPLQVAVGVPSTAIVERGGATYVLVQDKTQPNEYVRRRVLPVGRCGKRILIASDVDQELLGDGIQPLLPGESVVTRGTLELCVALDRFPAEAIAANNRTASESSAEPLLLSRGQSANATSIQ